MSKTEIFEDTEVSEEKAELIEGVEQPDVDSVEWSDWVMSLFDETELVEPDEGGDAMPKVAGLRRVARKVLGPISFSGPTQVFPSTAVDHPGRATVVFKIEFQDGTEFTEVGESYIDNTNNAVAMYPAAVASTRAEARALRKALGINRVSYDEITNKDPNEIIRKSTKTQEAKVDKDGDFKGGNLASDAQNKLINFLSDQIKVDREKFMLNVVEVQDDSSLTKKNASIVIDTLREYVNDPDRITDDIRQ